MTLDACRGVFECRADLVFRVAAPAQDAHESVKVAFQNAGAPQNVLGRDRLRDARAAASVAREPPGVLQIAVGTGYRIRSNAEIARKLPYRRQCVARLQVSPL